jgi:hypothetical protein
MGLITGFFPAKPGKSFSFLEITTADGKLKLASEVVDFSTLPRLVPLSFEIAITPKVWGTSLVLVVDALTAKPVVVSK